MDVFGGSWEDEIVVEKVLPPEKGMRYPICLAGRRACSPQSDQYIQSFGWVDEVGISKELRWRVGVSN